MLACPCPSGEFSPLQKAPAHRFPCCLWISCPCVGPVGTRTSHTTIWTLRRVRGTRREGAGIADGTSGLRVPSGFHFPVTLSRVSSQFWGVTTQQGKAELRALCS